MRIRKFYSQAGQDRWVAETVFNYKTGGFFVDIGAFDGIRLSNTYRLERSLSWKGLCIEADSGTFALLKRNRRCLCVNACVGAEGQHVEFSTGRGPYSGRKDMSSGNEQSSQGTTTLRAMPLAQLLQQAGTPPTIDYLSIDVEGMEEEVMHDFPFDNYRFLCATIERPNQRLRSLLRDKGYLLVADQPGMDAFYLHRDMAASYVGRMMMQAEEASLSLPRRAAKSFSLFLQRGLRSSLRRL